MKPRALFALADFEACTDDSVMVTFYVDSTSGARIFIEFLENAARSPLGHRTTLDLRSELAWQQIDGAPELLGRVLVSEICAQSIDDKEKASVEVKPGASPIVSIYGTPEVFRELADDIRRRHLDDNHFEHHEYITDPTSSPFKGEKHDPACRLVRVLQTVGAPMIEEGAVAFIKRM